MASTTLVFTKLLAAQWHYMWSFILYFPWIVQKVWVWIPLNYLVL